MLLPTGTGLSSDLSGWAIAPSLSTSLAADSTQRTPQSYLHNDFTAFATEPSPVGGIHLADYANAITAQLREMARHGKVTLVGHSFGGLAITLAAEATPDLIDHLVYLTAYVPVPDLPNGVALASLPEGQSAISGAILIGDPRLTGAQRINPRDADPAYIEKGRQALYNDVSTEDYLRFAVYCNPDLPLAVAFDNLRELPSAGDGSAGPSSDARRTIPFQCCSRTA